VLFTSHDRHFMERIATCVIEVRDRQARHYGGDYGAYLYSVNREIEEGERELAAQRARTNPASDKSPKAVQRPSGRDDRKVRKAINNAERAIARLDAQKREINGRLLKATDPDEALTLHNEMTSLTAQLSEAEELWCRLQEQLEAANSASA
jgi:ATP-binding cassette subfamily F protein 3